jgi:hypothetical protein
MADDLLAHFQHVRTRNRRSRTPEYSRWCAMLQRCSNPNNPQYDDYGDRGIEVCERWRSSFMNYHVDIVATFP